MEVSVSDGFGAGRALGPLGLRTAAAGRVLDNLPRGVSGDGGVLRSNTVPLASAST